MPRVRSALGLAAAAAILILFLASTHTPMAQGSLEQQVLALTERVVALEGELTTLEQSMRTNHPDPAMEQAAVNSYGNLQALIRGGRIEEARQSVASFLREYGGTRMAARGRQIEENLAVVGRPSPEAWPIERWFQGEGDFDADGTGPTLVLFWESWCPHCKREVPKIQKLHADYRDQGLQILSLTKLSRGATEESVRSFIDEYGLEFSVAKETGQLSGHFGVEGVPAAAVVRNGEIVWRGHPGLLSSTLIDTWLQ